MKIGKDIDSIYLKRVKGAKLPPPPDSWDNISARLVQKEEKKVFPLWMKLTGVAAGLLLIFSLFQSLSNHPSASGEITFRTEEIKSHFKISEVSATFEETMKESSVILQALILQSAKMDFQKKHQELTLAVEESSAEFQVILEASEPQVKVPDTHLENLEFVLGAEDYPGRIASSNEIAEVSPIFQKDEPENPSLKNKEAAGKFKLSTRVAPVYFNNFGEGNAIENSFSQKEVAGEVTFSYGVNLAYQVSENLNIRSGINKVDLAYNTREVSYNEVANTISFGGNSREMATLASPSGGTLSQKMGFYEIPLEIEYVLLDKKLLVGLIGGGSALFLQENQVALNSHGNSTDLGENQGMNNISFTTNLGLSLGYDVSRQLQFSMEPVMKLPLNTFKNGGNSSPYFFGIYSGFSYRF